MEHIRYIVNTIVRAALLAAGIVFFLSFVQQYGGSYALSGWILVGGGLVLFVCLVNLGVVSRVVRSLVPLESMALLLSVASMLWLAAYAVDAMPFTLKPANDLWEWTGTTLLTLIVVRMAIWNAQIVGLAKQNMHLIEDNPWNNEDELTATQQIVFDSLNDVLRSGSHASVALTGSWGVGKTKIIKELEVAHSEYIWFKFSPWSYTSEEALIEDFYIQLMRQIKKSLPGIQLSDTVSVIASTKRIIDSTAGKGAFGTLTSIFLEWVSGRSTPSEVISRILKDEDRKVIVFIDDSERIYNPALVNRTLQLAHYVKQISNTMLIMAFEREAIIKALPDHAIDRNEFIEKFFEIEINVPRPTLRAIEEQLVAVIPEKLQPEYVRSGLLNDMKSHRAIVRLADEYALNHTSVQYTSGNLKGILDIINRDDLLVISHIKLKYPQIFKDINENRSIYTTPEGTDEESMEYQMKSDEERLADRKTHFDALFESAGVTGRKRLVVSSLLADIFPSTSKALGSVSSHGTSGIVMRKERRIGLRIILDAYFSASAVSISELVVHEKIVASVIKVAEGDYTRRQLYSAVANLIEHVSQWNGKGWDIPLHLLTHELERNEHVKDSILEVARSMMVATLKLDHRASGHRKTRSIGQAFYIFVDLLLYRVDDDTKKQYIAELDMVNIMKTSQTPFGSLLIARLSLNSEAATVRKLLNEATLQELNRLALKKFEDYYLHQRHDMIVEEDEDLYAFIESAWQEIAWNNKSATQQYSAWLKKTQMRYPSVYLDRYTTKTHRGNWAFKESSQGVSRPAQDLPTWSLDKLQQIVQNIKSSPHLSSDDRQRIKMIVAHMQRNEGKLNAL